MGIAQRPDHYEGNRTTQQQRKTFLEFGIARQPRADIVARRVLDEEVNIGTGRVKRVGRGRAKDLRPHHAVLTAQGADGGQMLLELGDQETPSPAFDRKAARCAWSTGILCRTTSHTISLSTVSYQWMIRFRSPTIWRTSARNCSASGVPG